MSKNAYMEPVLTPSELKEGLPATGKQLSFIQKTRSTIQEILDHNDPRLLLIVGPCSVHDTTAALEFASKLQKLSVEIADVFFTVMRVYFEKPRTVLGWKGMIYDPDITGRPDINKGLRVTRQLLLELAECGVATAAEVLDPTVPSYLADLLSWTCIGARTAESQTHRQLASGLPMPIAFKNSTDGNIPIAVNGILSASVSHSFLHSNDSGHVCIKHTQGNPYAHLVLRGGAGKPNYDPQSIDQALHHLKQANLLPRLLVDCAHDNSKRNYLEQARVFQSLIHQAAEGNQAIRGILLESNLFAGCQSMHPSQEPLQYGVSITDPCLDWETTEELIRWACKKLRRDEKLSIDYAQEIKEPACL